MQIMFKVPGGNVQTLVLPEGSTCRDAARAAGLTENYTFAVNKAPAEANTVLEQDDVVIATLAVKGGK
jgi:hypothetical protein